MARKIISFLVLISMMFTILGAGVLADVEPSYEQDTAGFVTRLYGVCLNRNPDPEGLNYWTQVLENETSTGCSVAAGFIFSEEFQNKDVTDDEYVEYMYNAFFGRGSDEPGKEYWVSQMNEGMSREKLFEGFANSAEFFSLCRDYGIVSGSYRADKNVAVTANTNLFVNRLYTILLGRECDQEGMIYWTNTLLNGNLDGINVAYGFAFSKEYKEQNKTDEAYVSDLYRAFMNREPDSEGLQFWENSLTGGTSRIMVFADFMNSEEFKTICSDYGINRGADITLPNYRYLSLFQSIRNKRNVSIDSAAVQNSIHAQCEYWLSQGIRYRFGAKFLQNGYTIDCSGFVTAILRRALGTMADIGPAAAGGAASCTSSVNFSNYQDMTYRGYWYDNRTKDYPKTEGVYRIYSGGSFYVDRYGIGSPLGMDTYEWEALFNNYYPVTSDTVSLRDMQSWATWHYEDDMPADTRWLWLDAYNEGDIIIWYNSRGVSVHTGYYDGHGGVYHSSSFNLSTFQDDDIGAMHSDLQAIGNYRNSSLSYFVIYHVVD